MVARDADWSVRFDQAEDALPFVAQALETWAQAPNADIRWRVEGVVEGPARELDSGVDRDGEAVSARAIEVQERVRHSRW